MGWKRFNDRLALIVVLLLVGVWIGDAVIKNTFDQQVIGASILAFGMIIQFYFRRKEPPENGDQNGGTK